MANKKYSDLTKHISESVSDIDTHLKSAGYDMFMTNKQSGTQTLDKIRRKVKALEGKASCWIAELEKEKESVDNRLRTKMKRECELEKDNEQLRKEIKRLRQEMDDVFPEVSDSSFNITTSQEDGPSVSQEASLEDGPSISEDEKVSKKDKANDK